MDELAATAAAALATLPMNKPVMPSSAAPLLPSGGSIGTAELPLFAGGALQPPETEKNGYSESVASLMLTAVAHKRPPAGGTTSRRRVTADAAELDMAVVTDQLCNRRYHIKELSQHLKVGPVSRSSEAAT